jgi:hypothetical protein
MTKRLPTPTMMSDYSAASPRFFPHTCSLCNIECAHLKVSFFAIPVLTWILNTV